MASWHAGGAIPSKLMDGWLRSFWKEWPAVAVAVRVGVGVGDGR